jgi:hypothetical protein
VQQQQIAVQKSTKQTGHLITPMLQRHLPITTCFRAAFVFRASLIDVRLDKKRRLVTWETSGCYEPRSAKRAPTGTATSLPQTRNRSVVQRRRSRILCYCRRYNKVCTYERGAEPSLHIPSARSFLLPWSPWSHGRTRRPRWSTKSDQVQSVILLQMMSTRR